MKKLLDTNICIYLINKKDPEIIKKLKNNLQHDLYISSITIAELEYGIEKSQFKERNKLALIKFLAPFKILNFSDLHAISYGRIRADLEKRGEIIGSMDLLIAAQAFSEKSTIVTNNTKEFSRVEKLKIENWI